MQPTSAPSASVWSIVTIGVFVGCLIGGLLVGSCGALVVRTVLHQHPATIADSGSASRGFQR